MKTGSRWKKTKRGFFLPMDKKGHGVLLRDNAFFHFSCSFGPNSDRSYSGCFYGLAVYTLGEAKAVIEKNSSDVWRGDMFTNALPKDNDNRYTNDGGRVPLPPPPVHKKD